jgi:hypothetical protein
MEKSEHINELAAALSKLQGEVVDAHKNKKGYGYNYAELSGVLDILRPLLSKYGIAVVQLPGFDQEKVRLETVFIHSSGQWISSTIEMGVEKGKGMSLAQSIGSVITYARRYGLAAMGGITQTDNDAAVDKEEIDKKIEKIDLDHKIDLQDKINELGDPKTHDNFLKHYGIKSLEDLPKDKYEEAAIFLSRKLYAKKVSRSAA